ncbi:HD-GYP domain-containing protein [Paenibacillus elgii]|uniref:HD-GYP domain-containing protein n=1 Tax=Paenibacillus elgii TaxID=189691 RepID=UPI001F194906|nr:HD-GYP domain-containing protein [Paenibacillus elgii]
MRDRLVTQELVRLMEKDVDTYEHSLRVGKLAKSMALMMRLNLAQTRQLVIGCCLHDIGKIYMPDSILKKDTSLTEREWRMMKQHPVLGSDILKIHAPEEQEIIDIVEFHHERWNGTGYPYGLSGVDIPAFARICTIIDSFDSMLSDRPYRSGMSLEEAKEELRRHSGTQFDKQYVELFLQMPGEMLHHSYARREGANSTV